MAIRIPREWRVPIIFVVLWVAPVLVGAVLLLRTWGTGALIGVTLSLLVALAGAYALLRRSRLAWWILVVLYGIALARWLDHVGIHGLDLAWGLWGVVGLVNFSLLISAPMRRFVRLRGRLAA